MKARTYKAGVAVAAVAAGVSIFGLSAAANATTAVSTDPVVTRLSFVKGNSAGGGILTITGKNFGSDSTVQFGAGTAAANGTDVKDKTVVLSSSQILVTVPKAAAADMTAGGKVDVVVTSGGVSSATAGKADDFTYLAPLDGTTLGTPLLSPLGKSSFDVEVLNLSTVADFKKVKATVNGKAATVASVDTTHVKITAPVGTPSAADATVVLYNDGVAGAAVVGKTTGTDNAPQYAAIITKLSKTSGPLAGGDKITVTGKGLTGASAWSFGTKAVSGDCAPVAGKDDTAWTCDVPSVTTAGPVTVNFTSASGKAALGLTAAATYTYSDLG
jgi:hypothetical protein